MKLDIPTFKTKKELFDFLVENKSLLESQKRSSLKEVDTIPFYFIPELDVKFVNKSSDESENPNEINVKAIINTTNILDSHGDVHIKGIWNKSLKENKRILHVQEHKSNEFDKIISSGEDLKASVKTYSWKQLGYDVEGKTQALVFDSVVKESRNAYMFDQYSKGYVDNHSVGMRYVKLAFAINSDDYPEEKAVWDKYYEQIVNKADVDAQNYFWAVTEAKVVEGSAVPMGSNPITPTMNIKGEPTLLEMIDKMDTHETKAAQSTFDIMNMIKKTNFNLKIS